jgi:hypothetical protein
VNDAVWKDYDDQSLPELTERQLAAFKRVTPKQHRTLSKGKVRPVGRPKKTKAEKENPVSIRLSKSFLRRLKARAKESGYTQWQSYAKLVLNADIEHRLEIVH